MKELKMFKHILLYSVIFVFLLFILTPLIEMVFTSFQSMDSVFSIPHPLLPEFHISTYTKEMWEQVPLLPRYFLNSLIISFAVTIISICLASPAGYSISRFKFPGRHLLLLITLSINMFSPVILLVPLYKTMAAFRILNTYWSMILPGAAFTLPFCIWMLAGYFKNIPKDLEEASFIDGCSRAQTLIRIVLPLSAPGLVTAAIYSFIVSWSQQFIFALAFATDKEVMPITRGIYEYFGRNINQWNTIMSSSVIAIVPVIFLFIFLQRYLIQGLTAGATKMQMLKKMKNMRVAIAQIEAKPGNKEHNIDKISKYSQKASKKGARLIIFPELSVAGYPNDFSRKALKILSEPVPGPSADLLLQIAKKHSIDIIAGLAEKEGNKIFDTSLFVRENNVEKYRKTHVHWTEPFSPGNKLEINDTIPGGLGILICFDASFSEPARILTLQGAKTIAVPSAVPESFGKPAQMRMIARALDNQIYLLYSNLCGKGFAGDSMVVGPRGEIIVRAGKSESLLICDLDFAFLASWRKEEKIFPGRRPELYGKLTDVR